jgi:hypothetical protein
MNALRICKMRNGVSKTPSISSLFSTTQVRNEYLRSYLNCCTIVNSKTRKRFHTLKVHKIKNFFGSDFEFCVISLLLMLKY